MPSKFSPQPRAAQLTPIATNEVAFPLSHTIEQATVMLPHQATVAMHGYSNLMARS
jgi:hypothetical protein